MNIRSAVSADVPALMALERSAATAAHWSAEQYQAIFSNRTVSRIALVIEQQSRVEGFLIARAVDREWEIENLAVAGPARRHGHGTRLLGSFLDNVRSQGAQAVFLEVRESNLAARRLYEKWAFVESGIRRRYYHEPEEDAVTYRFTFA
jgi:[ribosomal protein S18]-alanine N-acetyltransferase